MRQGEIWLANLNPIQGSEQQGLRPVVIISCNSMNSHLEISIICPISSKIKNYAGCLVLQADKVNGLDLDSEVITFQIRSISHTRLMHKLGKITKAQLGIIKTISITHTYTLP